MSTNPSGNQPPYPNQQPTSQYPPAMFNYGSSAVGYPPPSNQAAYPPPVETVPYNAPYPATAPPPSYESAVGGGKSEKTPGNSSYQSQPFPAAPMTSYPTYPSSYPDVEYGQTDASHFSEIISFNDKSIRLGKFYLLISFLWPISLTVFRSTEPRLSFLLNITHNVMYCYGTRKWNLCSSLPSVNLDFILS